MLCYALKPLPIDAVAVAASANAIASRSRYPTLLCHCHCHYLLFLPVPVSLSFFDLPIFRRFEASHSFILIPIPTDPASSPQLKAQQSQQCLVMSGTEISSCFVQYCAVLSFSILLFFVWVVVMLLSSCMDLSCLVLERALACSVVH